MEQEKVTEELVRQNGNQAAAVMADYAAQGGGGSETGVIPEGNYVRVQENAALTYVGENGETVFTFEPMDIPRRIFAAAVDTSSYPDGVLISVASSYNLSTQENVEKAYKSMVNGFMYVMANGNIHWVKPTAFTTWNPATPNYIEVMCGGASRTVALYRGA